MANQNNEFTVDMTVDYHWEPLREEDNRENPVPIRRIVEVVKVLSLSYKNMIRSIRHSAIDQGHETGGIFDVIGAQVEGDSIGIVKLVKEQYEYMLNTRRGVWLRNVSMNSYTGQAHGNIVFQRLVLRGPGLSYATERVTSAVRTMPDGELPVQFIARLLPVLKDVEVKCTDGSGDPPQDIIKEASGLSSDVTDGLGGKSAWLRPIWTMDVVEGATGLQVLVTPTPNENPGYLNVDTAEQGGVFRYLKMLKDPHSKHRITEIALWRSEDAAEVPTANGKFQFTSGNLNEGRGGDYLYLCWNTRVVQ